MNMDVAARLGSIVGSGQAARIGSSRPDLRSGHQVVLVPATNEEACLAISLDISDHRRRRRVMELADIVLPQM
jgi:hypothetical protein